MSKASRRARTEARAQEIATALAQASSPALVTKGASTAPVLPVSVFLPVARLLARSEARIERNGRLITRLSRDVAAMAAAPPVPESLAWPSQGSRQVPFDPAQWRTGLIPAVPAPSRNGSGPAYRDGPHD